MTLALKPVGQGQGCVENAGCRVKITIKTNQSVINKIPQQQIILKIGKGLVSIPSGRNARTRREALLNRGERLYHGDERRIACREANPKSSPCILPLSFSRAGYFNLHFQEDQSCCAGCN